MKVQDLRNELANGVTDFAFIKKDGSVRVSRGTTNLAFVPMEKHPKTKKSNQNVVTFFDLDKKEWRSMSSKSEFVLD
jgi:hypothetical protein